MPPDQGILRDWLSTLDNLPDLYQAGQPMRIDGGELRAFDLESVSQGAKRAGLNASYFYRLIRDDKLDAYVVGGRIMLHRSDVDAFIQGRRAS